VAQGRRDKKRGEWALIESARARSDFFPAGELSPFESPDWLIRDADLGIEVSDLLRPKGNNRFSGAQLSSYQTRVVEKAQTLYFSQTSVNADVLVFFKNEWNQHRDVGSSYAASLAEFVRRNIPVDRDSITLQARHLKGWVDGVSVIRISRSGRRWRAAAAAHGQAVEYADVAERIAAKNRLLPEYRRRLPGWKLWLLLATEIRVLHSVWIPPAIAEWRFAFDFDRVLLMPWDGDMIELVRK
jgi:hypothetical protein